MEIPNETDTIYVLPKNAVIIDTVPLVGDWSVSDCVDTFIITYSGAEYPPKFNIFEGTDKVTSIDNTCTFMLKKDNNFNVEGIKNAINRNESFIWDLILFLLSHKMTISTSNYIAEALLSINAIQFSVDKPFSLASGGQSPIYCDCRLINSDVRVRNLVLNAFVSLIKELPEVELIVGIETGGIAMGMLIADRLGLPFIASNKHYMAFGKKGIVIEDLVLTGKSSSSAIEKIHNMGVNIIALMSIVTYGTTIPNVNKVWSLCHILDIVRTDNRLTDIDKELIENFVYAKQAGS